MDWLEEKAEQFRRYLQKLSLEKSLFWHMLIALMGVLTAFVFTKAICESWLKAIYIYSDLEMYNIRYDGWMTPYIHFQDGEVHLATRLIAYCYQYCPAAYLVLGLVIATRSFFKMRIYPALNAAKAVVDVIRTGDSHSADSYFGADELGGLCRDLDEIRKMFLEEKRQQWARQEQQRQINAAFAHDMRTPLTVIRGYTEFLLKYVPQGKVSEEILLEKLRTMQFQEERLLEFSKTMGKIQKMEELEVECRWLTQEELKRKLTDIIIGLQESSKKQIRLQAETCSQVEIYPQAEISPCPDKAGEEIFADMQIVAEVFENILSNALRYAQEKVSVTLQLEEGQFRLYIKDDGRGFSEKALALGWQPYFREGEDRGEHFGIGLSISKTLCEKHGGAIQLLNSIDGGAIVIAKFRVGQRTPGKRE